MTRIQASNIANASRAYAQRLAQARVLLDRKQHGQDVPAEDIYEARTNALESYDDLMVTIDAAVVE